MPSSASLDPAILRALHLPSSTPHTLTPHGGSTFSTTSKLTLPSTSTSHFLKTLTYAHPPTSGEQLAGEAASLAAIADRVPALAPKPVAHGPLDETTNGYFLLTDFITPAGSDVELARKLGELHTAPGSEDGRFGFDVPTWCGATRQDNTWESSWITFFSERRLRAVSAELDMELRETVDAVIARVVPRLLGALKEIRPVCVHGDLWSGNALGAAVVDPAACFAHSEFELGIMKMFGGFGAGFMREYHKVVPKCEPVGEYEDRVELYMLYHRLNHALLFGGGGYREGALRSMKSLLRKYGGETDAV
ncbi:Fructosamine/Ketosamine-3-kinase [Geopyxis carbonaria]|nr:Fructosamine/Ketosamine-3-kinase [Geopyxis carbonaria]